MAADNKDKKFHNRHVLLEHYTDVQYKGATANPGRIKN